MSNEPNHPYGFDEFAYLWDGSQPDWVLLTAPELLGGYRVFNTQKCVRLHFDSDELNAALCQRMKEVGCEVLDKLPKGPSSRDALD
jgi:hypothetical protein